MEVSDLAEVFRYLQNCCLHELQWHPREVSQVLAGLQSNYSDGWKPVEIRTGLRRLTWKDGSESQSVFAVRLRDGSYGLLAESEDYTGHGCMCSAFTGRYGTLPELLAACTPDYGPVLALALRGHIDAAS